MCSVPTSAFGLPVEPVGGLIRRRILTALVVHSPPVPLGHTAACRRRCGGSSSCRFCPIARDSQQ